VPPERLDRLRDSALAAIEEVFHLARIEPRRELGDAGEIDDHHRADAVLAPGDAL
jgi:hypothetical protein